jgi:hypothetical protein
MNPLIGSTWECLLTCTAVIPQPARRDCSGTTWTGCLRPLSGTPESNRVCLRPERSGLPSSSFQIKPYLILRRRACLLSKRTATPVISTIRNAANNADHISSPLNGWTARLPPGSRK